MTEGVVNHWNRLPRAMLVSPNLDVFGVDVALCDIFSDRVVLSLGLDLMILKDFSNLSDSVSHEHILNANLSEFIVHFRKEGGKNRDRTK